MSTEPKSKATHWATHYDAHGDLTGKLVRSRQGLIALRALIDEAVDQGSAKAGNDVDFDFAEIKVEETHPRDTLEPSGPAHTAWKYGCLSLLLAALALMGAGGFFIFEKIFR